MVALGKCRISAACNKVAVDNIADQGELRMQVDAELQKLGHDDLVSFYSSFIMSSGQHHRKLVVASVSQTHGEGACQLKHGGELVPDIEQLKASLPIPIVNS